MISVVPRKLRFARSLIRRLTACRVLFIPKAVCVTQLKIDKTCRMTCEFKSLISNSPLANAVRVVVALIVCVCPAAQEAKAQDELPTLEQMWETLPSADELVTIDPYDWIVLKTGGVLKVEPVSPRPDTLKKMAEEKARLESTKGANKQERDAIRDRLDRLKKVEIVLPDNQAEDYLLPLGQIEQIIAFEDLMLRRVDMLLEAKEIRKAYELLIEVDRRAPGWSETVPRFDALLLREASLKLGSNEPYAALALMDELADRNIANAELPGLMSGTLDGLIKAAVQEGDFPKARYLNNRLMKYFPQHPVATGWIAKLQRMMSDKLAEARQLSQKGEHSQAALVAQEADYIWRTDGNQRSEYSRYVSRYQRLRVPVRRFLDEEIVSPVELSAAGRHRELTTVQLFEPTSADDLTYYQSSFFEQWDPQDLGREVVFSLRQTRPYWQSQPVLTANQVADSLALQLDPQSTTFNPRLASFIREFSVRSPTELQISFTRVPLNLEALFRFPVTAVSSDDASSLEILSKRFELVEKSADRRTYRRTIPEPDGLIPSQYHVAEIEELRFADRESEIRAFQRKQIDVLPYLFPWEVDIFKGADRAFVQQYAIPTSHVIVFNPMSPAVSSAQLRRGLSFGVDRENLLKKVILRDPAMKHGRVTSAPWNSESYANSPLVDAPEYDHYLSYLLRLAALEQLRIPDKQKFVADAKAKTLEAKQEWDEENYRKDHVAEIKAAAAHIELPVLRMVCDPDEVAMLAAEQMVKRWEALGYKIKLIPGDTKGPQFGDDDWDLMYRRSTMQEPLFDLWELLLTDGSFDVNRLSSYPDWMRQELINLDYATSFLDAQERLFLIHRHMTAQGFLVPLWEIDEFIALQKNIAGFEPRPVTTYHGVERWLVKP